ncbi:hypothetical protein [Candidatus Nitrosotenuis aquarius]|uniref:hypothetical protein n=1 Tax=Candidatus Nitrosotenuis aquarius TaxID=1846278 RepID=UPI0013C2DDCC|nr:hypothetical protein [Candidatus Nitrosotenuis aquarius]
MEINTENAKRIDSYISDYPTCKTDFTEKVTIQDKITRIPVYRLPLNMLFYNVQNGRFAAEYIELKKKLGRELDSQNPNDAKEIEKMLRDQNDSKTKWLKEDIRNNGQRDSGIITHDGFVINGNRRMSVLNLLAKEDPKYGYMEVARLPPHVSESDVYKIEIGIQLAREEQLDYGPINELLKIKQGVTSGLTEEQIAKTLSGFTVDDIKERLERLTLIEEYLDFIKKPGQYLAADGLNEHFIDFQKSILSKNKNKKSPIFGPLDLLNMKQVAFSVINQGATHMEIRKIPNVVLNQKIKPIFITAAQNVSADPKRTKEIFETCLERVKAEENRDRPYQILNTILGNLEALDYTNPELKKAEYDQLIKKILGYLQELQKLQ